MAHSPDEQRFVMCRIENGVGHAAVAIDTTLRANNAREIAGLAHLDQRSLFWSLVVCPDLKLG